MKIGSLIKELRLNKGITQNEVALKIGISRSVLSQYENNIVEPTAYVVSKLSEFFDVSADYLLGLEDDFGARIPAPMGESVNADERELLQLFRELSPYLKGLTLSTVRSWANKSDENGLHKKA